MHNLCAIQYTLSAVANTSGCLPNLFLVLYIYTVCAYTLFVLYVHILYWYCMCVYFIGTVCAFTLFVRYVQHQTFSASSPVASEAELMSEHQLKTLRCSADFICPKIAPEITSTNHHQVPERSKFAQSPDSFLEKWHSYMIGTQIQRCFYWSCLLHMSRKNDTCSCFPSSDWSALFHRSA